MLKPIAAANSLAAVSLAIYVICRALSLVVPDLLYSVGQSWFHTFSLGSAKTVMPLDFGTFITGALTLGLLAWITGYVIVALYNKWAK